MKSSTVGTPLKHILGWAATGVGLYLVTHAVVRELSKLTLHGKVVLITGGSRGFGLILARHLAARGAKLAIAARAADDLELARQDLEARGAQVIAMTVDVTENAEVKAMIRDVIHHYGRLDVLVNNAGVIQVGPQDLITIDDYRLAMQTNFWAQLYAMLAVIPYFIEKGRGRIVNITTIGGKIAYPHLVPHSTGKFAVGLSHGMHAELKKHNISVTTVVPHLMRAGSRVHADIKGDYKKQYARFTQADSDPLLSGDPGHAAEKIIQAIEYGEPEVTLSLNGKMATLIQGIAPGWVGLLMGIANRLLPDAVTGNVTRKDGWQGEPALPRGPISSVGDKAAARDNEN